MNAEGTKFTLQLVLDRCTREAIAKKSSHTTFKVKRGSYFEFLSPELAAKIALTESFSELSASGKLPTNLKINYFYGLLDVYFKARRTLKGYDLNVLENQQSDVESFLKDPLSDSALVLKFVLKKLGMDCPDHAEVEKQIRAYTDI